MLISPRKARKNFFAFIFQLSGWALVAPSCFCTASSRCTRIAGPGAAMCFFLAQISLTNVAVSFPSCSVLASQPLATSIAGLAPDQQLDSRTSYVHKVSQVSLVLSIGQPLAV